jgi:hypothetical protein
MILQHLLIKFYQSFLTEGTNEIQKLITNPREEPFITYKRYLQDAARLSSQDHNLFRDYKADLMKEAQLAYISREAENIRRRMHAKDVEVFSVSASEYINWLDPLRFKEPQIEASVTGIPSLRLFLLGLTAEENYQDLYDHVYEVLADSEERLRLILQKFTEDDGYAVMREYLTVQVPVLRDNLSGLATTLPSRFVGKPWTWYETGQIAESLKALIESYQQPKYYHATFSKMLRENGIPNGGAAAGQNMNDAILKKVKPYLKRWKTTMLPKVEHLASLLDAPVQAMLNEIKEQMDHTPSNPLLKGRAYDALNKTTRRIGIAHGRMLTRLEGSVKANYLRFATENDIHCTIAREMKPVYQRVSQMRIGAKRRVGIYSDQREELVRSLTTSNDSDVLRKPLVRKLEDELVKRQNILWKGILKSSHADVMALFADFVRITEDLLENETYMSSEHKRIRQQLSQLLPEFERAMRDIQGQFPGTEAQRANKRTRRDATPAYRVGSASTSSVRSPRSRLSSVKEDE